MPYVEENYPTAPYKILSGHSLGGLIAVYCMLHHPDYFNAYIAVSPSLQWDNKNLLQEASQQLNHFNVKNRRLFFCDANEDASFHQNQVELDSLLKKILPAKILYKRMFYPEESHVSEPVKAFYDGLRFIYPNWHLPYNSSAFKKTMNAKMIKDHFTELSNIYGYKVVPLHDEIIQISRFLRNDPVRTKDAIELLEMNASNYPSSAITQLTLGDTWMKAGNKAKAKDAYQLAVTLDPGNSQILQKIKNVSE